MCFPLLLFLAISGLFTDNVKAQIEPDGSADIKGKNIKYVLTFPSIMQKSNDFAFNLVLFEEKSYSLPVSFTANLRVDSKSLATQTFIQTKYGLQSHVFSKLKSVNLAADSYPMVEVTFNKEAFQNYTDLASSETVLHEQFVFIQTDKAMYKPTHNVQFRAVVLDRKLSPVSGIVNVTLMDPKDNQLKMWSNQQLTKGVFSASYQLSDFVNLGDWTITVQGKDIPKTGKTFTVQQYVLPKYEVKLDFATPANKNGYWLFNPDSELTYQGFVRAKYTFGKPVKGVALVTLISTGGCNWHYDYPDATSYINIKRNITKVIFKVALAGDGSANDGSFTANGVNNAIYNPSFSSDDSTTITPKKPVMYSSECRLAFQVNVTEDLTGEIISGEGSVTLYRDAYKIQVHDSVQKTLKPGLPFTMRFQISTSDGQPVGAGIRVDEEVYFFNQNNSQLQYELPCYGSTNRTVKPDQTLKATTDADGLVSIKVPAVPKDATFVIFSANIVNTKIIECESKYTPRSPSKQAVSIAIDRPISASKTIPKVGDHLTFRIEATFKVPMVYFMFVQNGRPLQYKQLTSPTSISAESTKYSIDIALPQDATPRCAALVWTVENSTGEILADALEFKVDGLVRQTVLGSFSPATVRPGDKTTLSLSTSESHSFVALLAVDKSVRLLKSGNDITLDDVVGTVSEEGPGSYSPVLMRCLRCGWWPWWIDSSSARYVFQGVGMVIKSNLIEPVVRWPMYYDMMPAPGAVSGETRASPTKVRVLFPETWIWQDNTTDGHGKLNLPLTAPDTITSWVLSAFSIGDKNGFGAMQNPVELTVFQDFFVNLDISRPTIIRGEQVQIKAVVFNYLTTSATVNLWLKKSDDFEVSLDNGLTFRSADFRQKVDVPANGGNSIPIWVRPKKLGKIKMTLQGSGSGGFSDAMEKEVLVEPEGEIRYANKPIFIRLTGGNRHMTMEIDVRRMLGEVTDDQVVEGSKMFQLQVIGDLLGPTLSQLGDQIRLPTGCGEQTMVTLAPNVYIYNYLKSANLMTDELQAKTTGFVEQGYQHELTYQRKDGGFSAFGNSDTESSTWLTAFVLRCFAAAKKYVGTEIPDGPIANGWGFIASQAAKNGSFGEPGRVLHSSMKGGATSSANLAAYIYTTAAESGVDMIPYSNTRDLIINTGQNTRDPYQLALIAYALSIRQEDQSVGKEVLKRLMGFASSDGGFTYWKPENDQTGVDEYAQSGPTQIETSAYALLAHMNLNGFTDDAIPIGRFLMSQRNSLGGFASTQDTVVGLQAIAKLASLLSSGGKSFAIDSTLNFDDNGAPIKTSFSVDQANAQLLQSFDPPRDRQSLQSVDLSIRGTGAGLVQLAMRYNVRASKVLDSGDYEIAVTKMAASDEKEVILEACARSIEPKPGMVLIEVGIPTGFDADLEQTQAANRMPETTDVYAGSLKRIELGDRKVVFYFDTLEYNKAATCVLVKMTRTMPAKNVQAPIARVYSYYEPSRMNAIEFTFSGMSTN